MNREALRKKLHNIIFEAETPLGQAFDIGLMVCIVLSVLVVMLESVRDFEIAYGGLFYTLEWVFTIIFTLEYILRLYILKKPWHYAISFFGIIDLLSIIPTYLSLFFIGIHSLLIIRILRLLRIFRIFKLAQYISQGQVILNALYASKAKIFIFLSTVLLIVTIVGTTLYLVEANADSGFTSIPRSIYWAIVTLTTVGYGDIAPRTEFGQVLAAIVMLLGYAIIAVPTGIVTSELVSSKVESANTKSCPACSHSGHDENAKYCKFCGHEL